MAAIHSVRGGNQLPEDKGPNSDTRVAVLSIVSSIRKSMNTWVADRKEWGHDRDIDVDAFKVRGELMMLSHLLSGSTLDLVNQLLQFVNNGITQDGSIDFRKILTKKAQDEFPSALDTITQTVTSTGYSMGSLNNAINVSLSYICEHSKKFKHNDDFYTTAYTLLGQIDAISSVVTSYNSTYSSTVGTAQIPGILSELKSKISDYMYNHSPSDVDAISTFADDIRGCCSDAPWIPK